MALNTLGKRNWLLIGGLIILSAGMIGACTYPTKTSTTPVMETGPVVAKPEEGISEETISPEPESETEPSSQPSQAKESEEITGEECYKNPKQALTKFLAYLHNGQYEKAARLYGGDYELLEYYNPTVDPQNRAALLAMWCEVNGGMCLRHRILNEKVISKTCSEFTVRFFHEDGSIYKIGPSVGQEGEKIPDDSKFEVVKPNGNYRIMQLPPYSP